jgi:ion channel
MLALLLMAVFLVFICIRFHCSILCRTAMFISRNKFSPTTNMMIVLLNALSAHIVEIFLYSLALYVNVVYFEAGHISGDFDGDLLSYFYFSMVSYTSLGLGDVWPHGPIRLLTGIEALNGLILIAWSASYTYSFHEKSMGGNTFEKQH